MAKASRQTGRHALLALTAGARLSFRHRDGTQRQLSSPRATLHGLTSWGRASSQALVPAPSAACLPSRPTRAAAGLPHAGRGVAGDRREASRSSFRDALHVHETHVPSAGRQVRLQGRGNATFFLPSAPGWLPSPVGWIQHQGARWRGTRVQARRNMS